MAPASSLSDLEQRILSGDIRALARAATLVENQTQEGRALIASLLPKTGQALWIGVTGPPGAGKSTLVDQLIKVVRAEGATVGVIAVDPTSPYSHGAILGDRIRMQAHHADPGVFIRSLASRGRMGGLAAASLEVALLLDAARRDVVLIETVGVGQDEVEIARLADVTVVVLIPGFGDDVQAIKAGIMEIADVFVINKADLPGTQRLEREIRAMQSLTHPQGKQPHAPVQRVIATEGQGIAELLFSIRSIHRARGSRRDRLALEFGRRVEMRPEVTRSERLNHKAEIGIIGGSGLYAMPDFEAQDEVRLTTPFGDPSDAFIAGRLCGRQVAFLARHGRGHRISPSELNFRANIFGFKMLGVERILSLSAVGSLKLEHAPLDFVIPDQFVDRTRGRISTFFGAGVVVHIGFADPVCPQLSQLAHKSTATLGINGKLGGTYLCMEGPAFSTRAESNLYRSWGMDIIGMTNLQEAKLAREAEICYVTIAMVTDYDCWHEEHEAVTVDQIMATLSQNAANARRLIRDMVEHMPSQRTCKCGSALRHAIATDRAAIPASAKEKLGLLLGKYTGE